MSKPLTAYTSGTDTDTTTLGDLTTPLNSLTVFLRGFTTPNNNTLSKKLPNAFTTVSKNLTAYDKTGGIGFGWLLNSTLVTLNSVVYLLDGFTVGSLAPDSLSTKPRTAYTPV